MFPYVITSAALLMVLFAQDTNKKITLPREIRCLRQLELVNLFGCLVTILLQLLSGKHDHSLHKYSMHSCQI